MKLTNRRIVEAAMVLEQWNPSVSFKTKMALSRNLQRLQKAVQSYEWDRNRLQLAALSDKSVRPEAGKPIQLTSEELAKMHPEHEQLIAEEQDIDIIPIPLFDLDEGAIVTDPGIDISKVPLPNEVLSRLLDVVLFESPIQ